MRALGSILALLVASGCSPKDPCADGGCDTGEGGGETGLYFVSEDPEPLYTAEEVGEQIQAFVDLGAWNVTDLADVLLEALAQGDETCPEAPDTLNALDGCTADSGYHYLGIAWYVVSEYMDEERTRPLHWGYGGDCLITTPEGEEIEIGGGGNFAGSQTADGFFFAYDYAGSFVDTRRDDWIGAGVSGVLLGEGTLNMTENTHSLTVSGGLSLGQLDLYFEDVLWDTSSECGEQPAGGIRLRDSRGFWYDWDLSGCGPCGDVVFHDDQELGELCLDLSQYGKDLFVALMK